VAISVSWFLPPPCLLHFKCIRDLKVKLCIVTVRDIQCSSHLSSIYHAVLIYTHSFIIVPPRRTFVVIKKFFSKNGNVKPWIISFLFCVLNTQKKIILFQKYIIIYSSHICFCNTKTVTNALPLQAEQLLPLVCLHAVSFQTVSG